MNKTNGIIIVLLIILIAIVGYAVFKKPKDVTNFYQTEENTPISNQNGNVDPVVVPTQTTTQQDSPKPATQESWFIPNQNGWVEQTLLWKTYSIGNVSFRYPSGYVVTTEKQEIRPGVFSNKITITNPNSRSEFDETIYVGVPYTGAADPNTVYQIKENVNNSGIDLAISLEASNYAKYIFNNIAASFIKK